jgi:hypothetical protein
MLKKCSKCGEEKPSKEFHAHRKYKDGLNPICKDCRRGIAHARYLKERDEILQKSKDYYRSNIESVRERHHVYWDTNKEKIRKKAMEKYYANWPEERRIRDESIRRNWDKRLAYERKYKAKKRAEDFSYKIHSNISRRLRESIGKGSKKRITWEKILGYTVEDLMKHIESGFQPGMEWDNYGDWHIDHKVPISHHKLNGNDDHEMILKCWCLNNLQPLWAKDNLVKGDKMGATVKQ